MQHFIQSDCMEDGQEAGTFAPDREEDDPLDLEYNGEVPPADSASDGESTGESSDSEDASHDADAETADAGDADIRPAAQGGTHETSFERFLAEWSDDDSFSKMGDSDAAAHAKPPRAPVKRTPTTGSSSAATSSRPAQATSTAPRGRSTQAAATRVPTGPAPLGRSRASRDAPLDVVPLRCRMPVGAPRTAGYVCLFHFLILAIFSFTNLALAFS